MIMVLLLRALERINVGPYACTTDDREKAFGNLRVVGMPLDEKHVPDKAPVDPEAPHVPLAKTTSRTSAGSDGDSGKNVAVAAPVAAPRTERQTDSEKVKNPNLIAAPIVPVLRSSHPVDTDEEEDSTSESDEEDSGSEDAPDSTEAPPDSYGGDSDLPTPAPALVAPPLYEVAIAPETATSEVAVAPETTASEVAVAPETAPSEVENKLA
ncbi:hypothetical protein MSPP1_000750 [Malassezia sp. CBS 17886]|nr:hypothetical protein MSPP1_000750 [Malassezia sp. CBS 17886]